MEPPKEIRSYRDLRIWQSGMDLAEQCYLSTRLFPKEELFGLTSQIRRAATSVPANIAEGHGRELSRSFVQYLRIAQGSLKELETHLMLATRVGYLDDTAQDELLARTEEIGKMIRSLIRNLQARES